jgi:uncharacterized protein YndB with AHSA1/START domain
MTDASPPVATAGMLIRRPVAEVFEAFVDPEVTRRFWFSHGSGRLEPGARVDWTWAMYGFTSPVAVTVFEPERRLAVDWGEAGDATQVEWAFEARGQHTFVTVRHSGFGGEGDATVEAALDGMNGFTLVLAGAKIWLEHGIEPRFVLDRHPDARVAGWDAS